MVRRRTVIFQRVFSLSSRGRSSRGPRGKGSPTGKERAHVSQQRMNDKAGTLWVSHHTTMHWHLEKPRVMECVALSLSSWSSLRGALTTRFASNFVQTNKCFVPLRHARLTGLIGKAKFPSSRGPSLYCTTTNSTILWLLPWLLLMGMQLNFIMMNRD